MYRRYTHINFIATVVFIGIKAWVLADVVTEPDNSQLPGLGENAPSDSAAGKKLMRLSLEELTSIQVDTVYGASKREQKITEAPSAVSVVTQEDMKAFGYRTLGDLLRGVRGFYVTFDRSYNFTGIRGLDRPGDFGGRVLINVDGHRLNEPIYDSAFTHTDLLIDMDLIDRVEIIRGPGSSLYGDNAFFTVINVITRTGQELNRTEVSGSVGSYDTYTGRLTYGNKFTNGLEMMLSGTYLDSAGHAELYYPEFSTTHNGVAEGIDGTTMKNFFASLAYNDLALEGGFVDRRKNVPTAQYGTVFNDPRFFDRDIRGYAELKYAHVFGDDWGIRARGYYDYYQFTGEMPFDYPPVTLNEDRLQAQWVGSELSVSQTLWNRHQVTLGVEARADLQINVANVDLNPPATYVQSSRAQNSFAVYAQDEVALLTNLTLNVGARYDHFSSFGDTVNPRAALIYSPWRQGTIKLLYGDAFRAPNAYELDYLQPTYKRNPHLGPETIRAYELVYEQGLADNIRATASVYLNQIHGLIGQTMDPNDGLNFFDNLARVDARGFELELQGRWQHGLRCRLSYTYAETEDKLTSAGLDNSPRHLAKAQLVVPVLPEKVFASLELQGMSARNTVQGGKVGGFLLVNATIFSQEIIRRLEVSASIYNLFNRRYRDPVSPDYLQDSILQDGRQFRLKATWRF